jgi:hypothetical protein
MPDHPPLTAAQLAEIYDREPTPAVLQLLREIRRLHEIVRRADQIRQMCAGCAPVAQVVWDCFVRELDAEPCLRDLPTPRQQRRIDESVRRIEERRKNERR